MKQMIIFACCFLLTACATHSMQKQTNYTQAAKINTELGLDYLQEKQFDRAKEKLLLAQQQAPKNIQVLQALAYFYQTINENEQANYFYEQALNLDANNAVTLNNYGVFLCRQRKYQTAIKLFLKAAQVDDNLQPAAAYENAGLCAMKMPDRLQAKQYFSKALELDSSRQTSRLELKNLT